MCGRACLIHVHTGQHAVYGGDRSEKWRRLMDTLGETSCEDYRNVSTHTWHTDLKNSQLYLLYVNFSCLIFKLTLSHEFSCEQ